MLQVPTSQLEQFGGKEGFDAELASFLAAVEAHKLTEGLPAPRSFDLIEQVVHQGGGEYEVIDDETQEPVPETVPQISRSQLLMALAKTGIITENEAIAAATVGAVPVKIAEVFDSLPPEQKFEAYVRWATAQVVMMNHPLVDALAKANDGMSEESVKEFFTFAASL